MKGLDWPLFSSSFKRWFGLLERDLLEQVGWIAQGKVGWIAYLGTLLLELPLHCFNKVAQIAELAEL